MVLDTSAIVAAIANEPDGTRFQQAMFDAASLVISSVTILETKIVLQSRHGAEAVREFDEMLGNAGIVVVPFDVEMTETAFQAFRRYGKGRGHPAQLNIIDCAAYAVAKIGASRCCSRVVISRRPISERHSNYRLITAYGLSRPPDRCRPDQRAARRLAVTGRRAHTLALIRHRRSSATTVRHYNVIRNVANTSHLGYIINLTIKERQQCADPRFHGANSLGIPSALPQHDARTGPVIGEFAAAINVVAITRRMLQTPSVRDFP